MIRDTLPPRSAASAMATARYVLPVPAGPTPKVTSCRRIASRYLFWPTVLAVTPGFRSCVITRSLTKSLRVAAPSCFTTFSAWANSRLRTGVPAFNRVSSETKRCLTRSRASAWPSSLIQPSRDVALTPSSVSRDCRLRGSLLKSCCATRAFSKWRVSVATAKLFCQLRAQFSGQLVQSLRQNSGAGQHRHEISVTVPARYDVNVQMLRDAGARDFAKIDADVEAVRFHQFRQRVYATPRQLP